MRGKARLFAAAAVVVCVFVGPAMVAANALDIGETVHTHVDPNAPGPVCVVLHLSSASQGNILGPTTICVP
jgi:hypothetical protein